MVKEDFGKEMLKVVMNDCMISVSFFVFWGFLVKNELGMFNKAWYYQNRGTNIKSHAHTTEFHLQNVPWEASAAMATPGGPTQACGPGAGRRGEGAGGRRWEKGRKTKNSPYKSSKRASQWYYHNDTGTNKNKN